MNSLRKSTKSLSLLIPGFERMLESRKFAAMKTIDQYNFTGKKALVRVDFNVPLDKTTLAVTDSTRIKAAIDTIKKILNEGGAVILMSHLGRPKDGPTDKYSLRHVVKTLSDLVGRDVKFVNDCIGKEVEDAASSLNAGENESGCNE